MREKVQGKEGEKEEKAGPAHKRRKDWVKDDYQCANNCYQLFES